MGKFSCRLIIFNMVAEGLCPQKRLTPGGIKSDFTQVAVSIYL